MEKEVNYSKILRLFLSKVSLISSNLHLIALTQFIEESFISKVNLIDDYSLKSLLANKNSEKIVENLRPENLDIKLFLLSSKNYVEIISKDFAKSYQTSVQVYQNEMGYLDKFVKVFAEHGDHRVYINYNDIISKNDNGIVLKNIVTPVALNFKNNSIKLLKKVYELIKYLTFQRIYRNNYNKHCINKVIEEHEKTDNETRINLCVILLEHKKDLDNKNVNFVFYQNLINNFNKNLESATKGNNKKKGSEEYNINLNYGLTNLEVNKVLNKLYKDFLEQKNIKEPSENFKLLFVVNDTQERFVFKIFKDENSLNEYLSEVDKPDFFEDSQFSVSNF